MYLKNWLLIFRSASVIFVIRHCSSTVLIKAQYIETLMPAG
jgi:hypothetical protein